MANRSISEKVWTKIKQAYLDNDSETYESLTRFGASRRSIAERASEQNWKSQREARKVVSSQSPGFNASRSRVEEMDDLEIVQSAIASLSGSVASYEAKSKEGAASALVKLIQLKRELRPPTIDELASQVVALGYSPEEFVEALKAVWAKTA